MYQKRHPSNSAWVKQGNGSMNFPCIDTEISLNLGAYILVHSCSGGISSMYNLSMDLFAFRTSESIHPCVIHSDTCKQLTPCPLHSWRGPPFSGLLWNWSTMIDWFELANYLRRKASKIFQLCVIKFLEKLIGALKHEEHLSRKHKDCSPEGTLCNSLWQRDLYKSGSSRS